MIREGSHVCRWPDAEGIQTSFKDVIKYKITEGEIQENSFFLADGHTAIVNKNKRSRTNRKSDKL